MSTTSSERARGRAGYSSAAVGVTAFAAIFMVLGGVSQVIQGLVALANDSFYVAGDDYLFELNITTWGWVHMVLGIVIALAGLALFQGSAWARTVAVILASVGLVANFLWLPHYPLWSMTAITFDVFVIWAVTMHGRDIVES
jgi:hypothetical protein